MISDKNSTILKIWDQLDATEQKDMVVELIDDIDDLCVATATEQANNRRPKSSAQI
ncbi:hypothetical protein LCGC14_3071510 [marine sediment metagenome]|uniref:Uncharacterized protein n=1 Tax=marine sediment metagenome TaxID=412755 RepID=A0A0F8WFX0_9ZZZZ